MPQQPVSKYNSDGSNNNPEQTVNYTMKPCSKEQKKIAVDNARRALRKYACDACPVLASRINDNRIDGLGGSGFTFSPVSKRAKKLFLQIGQSLEDIPVDNELEQILDAREVGVCPVLHLARPQYRPGRIRVALAKIELYNFAYDNLPLIIEKESMFPEDISHRGGFGFIFQPLSERAHRLTSPSADMFSWLLKHDLSEILKAGEIAVIRRKGWVPPNVKYSYSDDYNAYVGGNDEEDRSSSNQEGYDREPSPRVTEKRAPVMDDDEDENEPLVKKRPRMDTNNDSASPKVGESSADNIQPTPSLPKSVNLPVSTQKTGSCTSIMTPHCTSAPEMLTRILSTPANSNIVNYATPQGQAQAVELLIRAELSATHRLEAEKLKKTIEDMEKKEAEWIKERKTLMAENEKLRSEQESTGEVLNKAMAYIKWKEELN